MAISDPHNAPLRIRRRREGDLCLSSEASASLYYYRQSLHTRFRAAAALAEAFTERVPQNDSSQRTNSERFSTTGVPVTSDTQQDRQELIDCPSSPAESTSAPGSPFASNIRHLRAAHIFETSTLRPFVAVGERTIPTEVRQTLNQAEEEDGYVEG
jgi:hypothetical protein